MITDMLFYNYIVEIFEKKNSRRYLCIRPVSTTVSCIKTSLASLFVPDCTLIALIYARLYSPIRADPLLYGRMVPPGAETLYVFSTELARARQMGQRSVLAMIACAHPLQAQIWPHSMKA